MSASQHSNETLVIGGSGFIGTAILNQLTGDVTLNSQQSTEADRSKILALEHRTPISAVRVQTLRGDFKNYRWNALGENPPTSIIHTGRISGKSMAGRMLAGWQGARANRRLLNWLRNIAPSSHEQPRITYVSGSLVYGSRGTEAVSELDPIKPVGFQKFYIKAEEPFLEELQSADNQRVTTFITRAPWVIGNGSWFRQFYWRYLKENGYIPCFGDGNNRMSIIHVADCASLICRIHKEAVTPGIYNLCPIPAVTQKAFCECLSDFTQLPVRTVSTDFLRKKYGQTVYESLTFSLNLQSDQAIVRDFVPDFPTLESCLKNIIEDINNEVK